MIKRGGVLMEFRGKAAITGMSELRPTKNPGRMRTLDLLAQAAAEAIRDAGLKKQDIDGLLVAPPTEDSYFMWPAQVCEYLQIYPRYLNMVELGGASAAGSVVRGAVMVSTGMCRHCLCLSGGVWDSQVFNTLEGKKKVMSQAEIDFELPYGPLGFNSGYALVAKRHMFEYGTTPEQMAKIAVDQRKNALLNPEALFNDKPITVEDVLASPIIADPLHLLEIVRPCSGAAALIISRAEEARDMPHKPVMILGMGEAYTHNSIVYAQDLTATPIKMSASRAFAMAGLKPQDIDFVSLYDCYTITVLISLEDAGFCPKGEGGRFVAETDLTYLGDLPCNTHGGQLSFGQPSYAGGMSHITEAVRQIRGEAQERQVKKNHLAFVNGNGGVLSTQSSLILGRD
jgi:acetyl-CoA C-acetyltransferase